MRMELLFAVMRGRCFEEKPDCIGSVYWFVRVAFLSGVVWFRGIFPVK